MDRDEELSIPEAVPDFEIPQALDGTEIEDEEVKTDRASRRRSKQRQRRQIWRKNNQARDDSAQPDPISPSRLTSPDVEDNDRSIHDAENHSGPAQKTKRPRPSPRQRNEKLLADFRAVDTRLANWELMHMLPEMESEDPLHHEVLKRVSSCIRDVLARGDFPELAASTDEVILDGRVAWRAKELAFYQKRLLAANSIGTKHADEIVRRGLPSSLDSVKDVIYGRAVLELVIPQLEDQLQLLKNRLEGLRIGDLVAEQPKKN